MTFGDLFRSNGGSYDFGAMETFNQHAKIYQYAYFHQNSTGAVYPYPDNRTFGDLCRSRCGSYDFGAMETFNQHAKIYQYAYFHQNRTRRTFPISFRKNLIEMIAHSFVVRLKLNSPLQYHHSE